MVYIGFLMQMASILTHSKNKKMKMPQILCLMQ